MRKKNDELVITSDLENLILVHNFVEQICDQYNIPNHFGILSVALEQAVTNAVIHGNKSETAKNVTIRCAQSDGGICISVIDEGNGFDYTKYNNLGESECNGIFMMQTLSNHIEFADNGRAVLLTFIVEGIETATAVERSALMDSYFQSIYKDVALKQKTISQKKNRNRLT